jgi:hypothetical protein
MYSATEKYYYLGRAGIEGYPVGEHSLIKRGEGECEKY